MDLTWHQKEPMLSLDMIHRTGVKRDDAIIDVGGGSSLLVDYLYRDGYRNLSVLDISAIALSRSKKRLGRLAKHIDWIEADITAINFPCHFSLWHDRAVFHFLTEAVDRELALLDQDPGGQQFLCKQSSIVCPALRRSRSGWCRSPSASKGGH